MRIIVTDLKDSSIINRMELLCFSCGAFLPYFSLVGLFCVAVSFVASLVGWCLVKQNCFLILLWWAKNGVGSCILPSAFLML